MKTSVELDEEKVNLAKKLGNTPTLRKLLDEALEAYIEKNRQLAMLSILGSDFFGGNLDRMRNRHSGKKSSKK